MQHLIPFRPLFVLIIVIFTNGGIHWKKLPVLLPWIVKSIILEPFRLLEAIYVIIRKPAISKKPPVFIIGFYRSATTWLQELMRCDPDFRTPTIFQTVLPEVMLVLEPVLKPILQFISNTLNIHNPYHRLPFNWDFPGEEDVAINALSYPDDFNRIFQYPSHANQILQAHFFNPDSSVQKRWGKPHQYYTDKLSLKYAGKRLVLKSPPNTGRVTLLKGLYPQAKFIFIKRDQAICIRSTQRIWAINRTFSFEEYSDDKVDEITHRMYKVFHERYQREKQVLKANELVEVTFDELVENPNATIDRIYETLDLANSENKRILRQKLIDGRMK